MGFKWLDDFPFYLFYLDHFFGLGLEVGEQGRSRPDAVRPECPDPVLEGRHPAGSFVLPESFACPIRQKSWLDGGRPGQGLDTPVRLSEKSWAKSSNNSRKKMFLFWVLSVQKSDTPSYQRGEPCWVLAL